MAKETSSQALQVFILNSIGSSIGLGQTRFHQEMPLHVYMLFLVDDLESGLIEILTIILDHIWERFKFLSLTNDSQTYHLLKPVNKSKNSIF